MTQPEEAVGGEAPAPVETDPFLNIAEEMIGPDEADEDEEIAEEAAEVEADEVTAEEDEAEAIEAEELPPIDAPLSWDADAKEAFKDLPRALQETVQKREAERERFVQTKSQEAAQAQRNASIEAMKLAEQVKAEAVERLQAYAKQLEVKAPAPELMDPQSPHYNPAAYAQQLSAYQNISAQRENAQRDAEKYQAEQAQIQQARQQHEAEAFHQRLRAEVPEVFKTEGGQEVVNHEVLGQLTATAELLGFDPNQISDVTAIKALKLTSEWKSKAEKYEALMKKQMERVRSGKTPPPVAKPGTARLPEQTRRARGDAAWNQALNAKTRVQRDNAIADWAESSGFFD